jgi:hypothetical protein
MNAKTAKAKVLHHGGLLEGETLADALIRIQLAADIESVGSENIQLLARVLMDRYTITPKENRDLTTDTGDSTPSDYWTADHR